MKGLSLEVKIIGGVVVLIVAWVFLRGFSGFAKDASKATVAAASGAVAGTAEGLGGILGIPETDLQKCELACSNGETWNASKFCSANRFLTYLKDGK